MEFLFNISIKLIPHHLERKAGDDFENRKTDVLDN